MMVIAGAASLAYGGFAIRKENVTDLGALNVQVEVWERDQIPPVLSWALPGGELLVLVPGLKKK